MWQALALRFGCPIEELKTRMTHREFVYWCEVYKRRPFDDEHTIHLTGALLRADMRALAGGKKSKVNIEELIPYRVTDASSDLEKRIDEVL